jgi:hypothetical protein
VKESNDGFTIFSPAAFMNVISTLSLRRRLLLRAIVLVLCCYSISVLCLISLLPRLHV